MSSLVVRLICMHLYKYLGMFLLFILLFTGCSSHQKKSMIPEKTSEQETSLALTTTPPELRVEEAIKKAETHYEKGAQYHQQQHFGLASKEFDLALKALLDADIDAEAHYRLVRAYNEFSEKIYRLQELSRESSGIQTLGKDISEGTTSTTLVEDSSSDSNHQPVANRSQELPVVFGIPVEVDAKIQEWINRYSYKSDSNFLKGLERSTKYLPMIKKIFKAYDLPRDLIYLPLIESHFSPDAVSPSGAVGLWQFVRSTARNYGLRVDKRVDERRDPEKSTHAAAKYLKDLYRMLGSWDLVVAAYNGGEYKIHNAIGRYRTRDFEELSNTGYLSTETQNFVPMLKAAIIVASNPNKYGLYPTYESPLVYDDSTTPKKKPPIKTFTANNIKLKNSSDAQLLARIHFPNEESLDSDSVSKDQTFTAIPQSGTDTFGYERSGASSDTKRELITYRIQKDDNLQKIASKFKVSVVQIILWNNLNTSALSPEDELKIWIKKSADTDTTQISSGQTKRDSSVKKTLERNKIVYSVKKGDNLWQLSKNFNVKLSLLRKWNGLGPKAKLMPGDKLIIHLNQSVN